MANKAIEMIKVRQILRLYEQGHSKVQISILTGVARNTVKRYLRKFIAGQLKFQAKSRGVQYFLPMEEWKAKSIHK